MSPDIPSGGVTVRPWREPTPEPGLRGDAVHVWRAWLDPPPSRLDALRALLARDERARAESFHFERDRRHFVAARGLLRTLLGRYLGTDPASLRFDYGPRGKPALAGAAGPGALRFNLSHSGGLALYAFAHGRALGIDVERMRPRLTDGIAERFFSPREVAVLHALPPALRPDAFFACWTRKEAYIKARGDGLALELDRFDVAFAPGAPAALLWAAGAPDEPGRWSFVALDPAPGYAGAIAVEGRGFELARWHWEW